MSRRAGGILIFLASAAVTSLLFINFCGTVFQCGCQSLWAGAAELCNVHAAHGRHCPFCRFGSAGYAMVYVPIVAGQGLASFRPAGWGWRRRLALSLMMFPAIGMAEALILGWSTGYWD